MGRHHHKAPNERQPTDFREKPGEAEAHRRKVAAQAVADRLREPAVPPGLNIQFVQSFDMGGRSIRMDALYGFGTIRPEFAATIHTEETD